MSGSFYILFKLIKMTNNKWRWIFEDLLQISDVKQQLLRITLVSQLNRYCVLLKIFSNVKINNTERRHHSLVCVYDFFFKGMNVQVFDKTLFFFNMPVLYLSTID